MDKIPEEPPLYTNQFKQLYQQYDIEEAIKVGTRVAYLVKEGAKDKNLEDRIAPVYCDLATLYFYAQKYKESEIYYKYSLNVEKRRDPSGNNHAIKNISDHLELLYLKMKGM